MYFNVHEYMNQLEEKYVNKAVNDAVRLASWLAARPATRLALSFRKKPSIYNKICNLFKNKGGNNISFINLQIHVTKCNRFQLLLVGSMCKRPVYPNYTDHSICQLFHCHQPNTFELGVPYQARPLCSCWAHFCSSWPMSQVIRL